MIHTVNVQLVITILAFILVEFTTGFGYSQTLVASSSSPERAPYIVKGGIRTFAIYEKWSNGVSNIEIKYSKDNGVTWTLWKTLTSTHFTNITGKSLTLPQAVIRYDYIYVVMQYQHSNVNDDIYLYRSSVGDTPGSEIFTSIDVSNGRQVRPSVMVRLSNLCIGYADLNTQKFTVKRGTITNGAFQMNSKYVENRTFVMPSSGYFHIDRSGYDDQFIYTTNINGTDQIVIVEWNSDLTISEVFCSSTTGNKSCPTIGSYGNKWIAGFKVGTTTKYIYKGSSEANLQANSDLPAFDISDPGQINAYYIKNAKIYKRSSSVADPTVWSSETLVYNSSVAPSTEDFMGICYDNQGVLFTSTNYDVYYVSNAPPKPDITYENPSITITGNEIEISLRIRNSSQSSISTSFRVGFYLSTDIDITTSDTRVKYITINSLGANSYIDKTTSFTPSDIQDGSYYVGFFIDYKASIEESNESNNTYYFSSPKYTVAAKPNLTTNTSSTNISVSTPNTINYNVNIKNSGVISSGAFQIGYYLSLDQSFTNTDIKIGTSSVGSLNASSNTSVSKQIAVNSISPAVPPGNYYIGYIIDWNQQISESDETDNAFWIQNPKLIINSGTSLSLHFIHKLESAKTSQLNTEKILGTVTNTNQNFVLKVCADGSKATTLRLISTDPGLNLNNVIIRIKNDPNALQVSKFGEFHSSDKSIDGMTLNWKYTHPRHLTNMNAQKYRNETIQVLYQNIIVYELEVHFYTPPVVILHGLWGQEGAKDQFKPLQVKLIQDYLTTEQFINGLLSLIHTYPDKDHFSDVYLEARRAIRIQLIKMRSLNISAGKCDLLCHSMGGVITRYYLQSSDYEDNINRIITINTPHSGSQCATFLHRHDLSASKYANFLLRWTGRPVEGAVYDLQVGLPDNGISNLNKAGNKPGNLNYNIVPSHTISSRINFSDYENIEDKKLPGSINLHELVIRRRALNFLISYENAKNNYLPILFDYSWHDAIVTVGSQSGGLPQNNTTFFDNIEHTRPMSNELVKNQVINLLQQDPKNQNYYSQQGFAPIAQNFILNTKSSDSTNILTIKDNTCFNISNLEQAQSIYPGDTIYFNISTSIVTSRLSYLYGNETYGYFYDDSTCNNWTTYIIAPEESFGNLRVLAWGIDSLNNIHWDTLDLDVKSKQVIDSLIVTPNELYIDKCKKTAITVIGLFADSTIKNLLASNELHILVIDSTKARYIGDGTLFGLQTGTTTLKIKFQNDSILIPITVLGSNNQIIADTSLCENGIGNEITLLNSNVNSVYQLKRNGIIAGAGIAGNGNNLSLGYQAQQGTYTVESTDTLYGCVINSSNSISLITKSKPIIGLGKDSLLMQGQSITLDAMNPGCSYLWSDGSSSQTLFVDKTGQYWVEVTNLYGCSAKDTINITIPEPPSIKIISPKGGEIWKIGTTYAIKWISNDIQNIKIEYSINAGVTWKLITQHYPASNGYFSWTIPDSSSKQCYIRISNAIDGMPFAISPNPFVIQAAGNQLNMLYLKCGNPAEWTTPGAVGSQYKEISVFQDSGFTVNTLNACNLRIDSALLSYYSVLRLGGNYQLINYTAEEGIAIYTWVSKGGKLLADLAYREMLPVASMFGIDTIKGMHGGTTGLSWAFHGAPLPISNVSGPAGGGFTLATEGMDYTFLSSNHNLTIDASISGYPAVVHRLVENGKAVILLTLPWSHDMSAPGNQYKAKIYDLDNLNFVRNIIKYFKGGTGKKFTVQLKTNGTGAIQLNGQFLNTPYIAEFDSGASINIKAVPFNCGTFQYWEGYPCYYAAAFFGALPQTGGCNPLHLTINSNIDMTAHFADSCSVYIYKTNALKQAKNGNVLLNGNAIPDGFYGKYACGTAINLHAVPGPGYVFAGWEFDIAMDDPIIIILGAPYSPYQMNMTNPISYEVCGDKIIQARFLPVTSSCGDSITDNRDGKKYPTVLVGEQCWMAANLDVGTGINSAQNQTNNNIIEKYCYNNEPAACDIHGGLYSWNEMMQYTTTAGANGICPDGWHIPSDDEWKHLEGYVDSLYKINDDEWDSIEFRGFNAGQNIKSTELWFNNGNGSDLLGFRVLPSGLLLAPNFYNLGQAGTFWTSSETSTNYAWRRNIVFNDDGIYRNNNSVKSICRSVRCVKGAITNCTPQPDHSNAGPDSINIPGVSIVLQANAPLFGIGKWTVIAGNGGVFVQNSDPNTIFIGSPGETYNLSWTISNACGENSDTVVIGFKLQTLTINILDTVKICYGSTAYLGCNVSGGTPPYAYSWSPAALLNNPTLPNPIASPEQTTLFMVVVTDQAGNFGIGMTRVYISNDRWNGQNCNIKIPMQGVYRIHAVNENVAWVAREKVINQIVQYPHYAKTIDGGTTWQSDSLIMYPGYSVSQIFALDGSNAWMAIFKVGAGGKIVKTNNGGMSWTEQSSAQYTSPYGFPNIVHFWNQNEGISIGDPNGGYFEVYTTTNGGTNWVRTPSAQIPPPLADEAGIVERYTAVGTTVYFITNKARVFKTQDKGFTWTVLPTPLPVNQTYYEVLFKDADNGIIGSMSSSNNKWIFYRTTNGSNTWNLVDPKGSTLFRDIAYVPGSDGTLVAISNNMGNDNGGAVYSPDWGDTWYRFPVYQNKYMFGVSFSSPTSGYTGGIVSQNLSGGVYRFNGDCESPVTADFYAERISICVGDSVKFINTSSGAVLGNYWSFKGGNINYSFSQSPTVKYDTAGIFSVSLQVSNGVYKNNKTISTYITVVDCSCPVVTNLSADSVTHQSAFVNWDNASGVPGYEVRYKPISGNNWLTGTSAANQFVISGLSCTTHYMWQVRSLCLNGNNGLWSDVFYFTTLSCPCQLPLTLSHTNTSWYGATLLWDAVSTANIYEIRYKKTGDLIWNPVLYSDQPYIDLAGLDCGTMYEWQLRTICIGSTISTWSSTQNFTTAPCVSSPNINILNKLCDEISIFFPGYVPVFTNDYSSIVVVQYKLLPNETWIPLQFTTSNSITITNLQPESNYIIRAATQYSTSTGLFYWSQWDSLQFSTSYCGQANANMHIQPTPICADDSISIIVDWEEGVYCSNQIHASHQISSNNININISSTPTSPICATMIVNYESTSFLGKLNPGSYDINVYVNGNLLITGSFMIHNCSGPNWQVVTTGENHTIIIPDTTPKLLDGIPITVGDYLGVFYDSSGTQKCGGYIVWNGVSTTLTAYGAEVPSDNGFQAGEPFNWRLWKSSTGQEFEAVAEYMPVNMVITHTGSYADNGISGLRKLLATSIVCQHISLSQGWSMFSSYIQPTKQNIDSVFSAVRNQVVIVKNDQTQTYVPLYGINNIGNLQVGEGYNTKMLSTQTINVCGSLLDPVSNPLSLPSGWSMMGYLRTTAAPISTMLSGILGNVIIVKDDSSRTYIPSYGINNIVNMKPGEGYKIKLLVASTLTYPANTAKAMPVVEKSINPAQYKGIIYTGNTMTLILPDNAWTSKPGLGDEIGVFSTTDQLFGSAVYDGSNLAVSIMGDDATTSIKDGLLDGECFVIKHFDISTGNESLINVDYWLEGNSCYGEDAVSIVGKLLSGATGIENRPQITINNYPNPFKESTSIVFSLKDAGHIYLSIFDATGREVGRIADGEYPSGTHMILFHRRDLPSGLYFYELRMGNIRLQRYLVIIN